MAISLSSTKSSIAVETLYLLATMSATHCFEAISGVASYNFTEFVGYQFSLTPLYWLAIPSSMTLLFSTRSFSSLKRGRSQSDPNGPFHFESASAAASHRRMRKKGA
jgi:hypothetical protein